MKKFFLYTAKVQIVSIPTRIFSFFLRLILKNELPL